MNKKLKWIIIITIIAILTVITGVYINNHNKSKNLDEESQNNTKNQMINTNELGENETTSNKIKTFETGKTLVVYYSLTNRTERVAEAIKEKTGADLYRIETIRTYPDEVMDVSAEARKERESGELPKLKGELPNIDDYDLIIVGGPVWSSTVSTPLMSFLEQMDFKGKTVLSYWTDDGMPGHYKTDFKEQAKNANIIDGIGLTDVKDMSDEDVENDINNLLELIK